MKHLSLKVATLPIVLLTAWSSLHPPILHAQQVEEIVVTATKRGDTLIQDTALSVSAITGSQLKEIGALDFSDYYRQVPGLSVNDQGPGDKRYVLRGVNSAGAGTVGLYFDEVIITDENINGNGGRSPDIKLFDIDRIEVLRGPQGTTFGSSALAGVIRWLPNLPDYTSYSADAGANVGSTRESDDMSWQVDGMVNIPIIQDRLAVRLSGIYVDKAGYIDHVLEEDANHEDSAAMRGILAWSVTSELELTFLGMHQRMDVESRNYFNDEALDLAQSPTLNGGPLPTKYYSADPSRGGNFENLDMFNAKLVYRKDWGEITATSSFYQRETKVMRAVSAAWEVLSGGTYPADGRGRGNIENNKDRDLLNHEIRFASTWDSPFQVLVGAFMQDEERDFEVFGYNVSAETGREGPETETLLHRRVWTTVDEVAVFGELSWDLTDDLNVTGGVRWFEYDIEEQAAVVTGFLGPEGGGSGLGPKFNFSENDATFKGNISYKFNDDILTYFQVAEGFRSGGTNDLTAASIAGVVIPTGFGSDSLVNYELGLKTEWFDKKLVINGATYLIDWSNIQVRQFAVSPEGLQFAFRGNGGKAEVLGAELEVDAYPTENLQLGAGLAYTKAELTEDLPVPADGVDGDRIEYVPELSINLRGRYQRPLRGDWTGFLSGDWSHIDDQVNRLRPTNPFFRTMESYSLANVHTGINGTDWSAVLSVTNVFDEDVTIDYAFDFEGPAPAGGNIPDNQIRPWPRTVSLSFRKSFDF